MKTLSSKILIGTLVLASVFSCNKNESAGNFSSEIAVADSTVVSAHAEDAVSDAATMHVKDKKFIKTADVNMEVNDVYDATVFIEKALKDLGGFVTSSRLNAQVISEETFNTSDENATMVRKFQTENAMQVRVPTEKLGDFLNFINDKKVFLNSRVILAEDVTANIKLAELEEKRNAKTGENISQLKTTTQKVNMANNNMGEGNEQKVSQFVMNDQLKYSTVDIYLKEPKVRIAEIAVTNSKNIDNKYKSNFFYESKNAFVEGFYMIQRIIVGLVSIWPILLIGSMILYFIRKRKTTVKFEKPE